jgi:hypothetical protein
VEVRQPVTLAQTQLAAIRAMGLSPEHDGEAAKKRGAKIAESNRRRKLPLSNEQRKERRAAQQHNTGASNTPFEKAER